MLGIVASEATSFRFCLYQAPRSLSCLSREHPDGWGIAVYESGREHWMLHKHPACAGSDDRFADVAVTATGHSMVAHIRKRTVGPIGMDNTHPFHRGRWVFAHNGTIDELDALRSRTSPARRAEVVGTTDSELFFAYLLSRLDDEGGAEEAGADAVEAALAGYPGALLEPVVRGEQLPPFERRGSLRLPPGPHPLRSRTPARRRSPPEPAVARDRRDHRHRVERPPPRRARRLGGDHR
jgi:predicted glutamine amidotransferase